MIDLIMELAVTPQVWVSSGLILLVLYMVFESRWLDVTHTDLYFSELPKEFDGFRILLVSDFHSTTYGRYENRVVDRISGVKADLLVLAGDLKGRNTTPNDPIMVLLNALVDATSDFPFAPVYARGNHDRRGFSLLCDEREDIHSLRDRSIAIQRNGKRIAIAGTRRTCRVPRRMRPSFRKAMRNVDPKDFTIFVSHCPDFFRMAAKRGVDLQLSGDTHGGQITLPFFGPFNTKSRLGRKFCRGHVRAFGSQMYVTRGVGTTGPPFRLFCRPEISVLTLRRAKKLSDDYPTPRTNPRLPKKMR